MSAYLPHAGGSAVDRKNWMYFVEKRRQEERPLAALFVAFQIKRALPVSTSRERPVFRS